ncbi:ABC transporter permease [Ornithinimicrobium avium]|uniref:ABC transporter permease n=1 Tax=Ornithinimicrobium avium TaxID=2283195 RepID=A0A345NQI5_9MICO|nr:hypothetical protein [Ornithinimicrobium avium]AXH97293.1 hypothetical protein DV701_15270 [Ornithinimicrobium avium]
MPAATARHTAGRTGTGPLTGTGTLVRLMLRRDRLKLPAWVGGMGLFVVYVGVALPGVAPTEEALASVVPVFNQPVGRMFTGPGLGLDAPTYERFFAAGYVLYLFVIAALMNIMLLARHTRAEEQSGRAELVRANVAGRHAALTAALVVALVADVAVTLVVAGLASANGFAATGSLIVGVACGLVGLAFAGITAVTVQLSEYSRSAAGLAGGALGVAFVLRALGDMAQVGGSALSWASPLGWGSQAAPYVLDRWWPLLLHVALVVVTVTLAFWLQSRRDLGAGLVAARPGRPVARPSLGTPLGLAARLQRPSALAWGLAVVALGVVDGLFAQALVDSASELPPAIQEMFGTRGMTDGYLAFLAVLTGYVTSAYVVFAVQSLRVEEARGRAEAVLATPTSRAAWAGSHLVVVAAWAAAIMVATGLLTGLAAAGVTGDGSLLGRTLLAHVNLVPAVLVVLGLCALLYGWAPVLLAPVAWTLVGVMVLVGNFGTLLDLPRWLMDVSPLSHPAQVPVEELTVAPLVVLLVLAAVGVALGLLGLGRRQVHGRS